MKDEIIHAILYPKYYDQKNEDTWVVEKVILLWFFSKIAMQNLLDFMITFVISTELPRRSL